MYLSAFSIFQLYKGGQELLPSTDNLNTILERSSLRHDLPTSTLEKSAQAKFRNTNLTTGIH
jgi:hypothetical protein